MLVNPLDYRRVNRGSTMIAQLLILAPGDLRSAGIVLTSANRDLSLKVRVDQLVP
jgi:hypothetical protein